MKKYKYEKNKNNHQYIKKENREISVKNSG